MKKFAVAAAAFATEKRGIAEYVSSSMGCATANSQSTKPPSSVTATAKERSSPADPHPWLGAWMLPTTNATRRAPRAPPQRANCDASRFRIPESPPAHQQRHDHDGHVTRNTDPHQNSESKTPPTTGPSATPNPPTEAHTPSARPRALASVNTLATIATDVGMISAAPAPMTPRHPPMRSRSPRTPRWRTHAPNTTKPTRSVRGDPKRSPRLPPTSKSPANTRM